MIRESRLIFLLLQKQRKILFYYWLLILSFFSLESELLTQYLISVQMYEYKPQSWAEHLCFSPAVPLVTEENAEEGMEEEEREREEEEPMLAPRVKVAEDGSLIIDEERYRDNN